MGDSIGSFASIINPSSDPIMLVAMWHGSVREDWWCYWIPFEYGLSAPRLFLLVTIESQHNEKTMRCDVTYIQYLVNLFTLPCAF